MTIINEFFSNLSNIFSSKDNNFKIFLEHEFSRMPQKAHKTDAGWDLSSCEHQTIPPKQWLAVDTGIKMVIPEGWEIQIRPRSGLALKKGIMVMNSPGTIDCEYRNRIKVILYNGGEYPFDIHPGDRIAQAVMSPVFNITMTQIEDMPEETTSRDQGGFGSTGS